MADFEGMRWFKCDFQVQTPEDARHWADDETRLLEPRTEPDLQEKARTYLRRCHDAGLEVIGVTDHNFSGRSNVRELFLTHLIEQNKTVAEELGVAPIVIFPGFEIDIGYHLLCLFEPLKRGADLSRVNDVLTTLGLAPSARFNSGIPAQLRHEAAAVPLRTILNKVQKEAGGMVIAAHAFTDRGICNDSANIGDFCLDELLCVEISDFPLRSKAKNVLEGNDPNWRRNSRRQPAYVMSSDAKSLRLGDDGIPKPNSIGYRHSWLKMSAPSIEALRQAFLDHDSRVRLQDARPSDVERHPRLVSVSIKGAAFLEDQTIQFSPNLNCVIGGRGSGKSSLLEYLRFCLQPGYLGVVDSDLHEKLGAIRSTIANENSELRVAYQVTPGVEDTVVLKPASNSHRLSNREVQNLEAVLEQLRVQFFSQGELSRLSKPGQKSQVLRLIDASCGDRLAELANQESNVRGELEALFTASHQAESIEVEAQRTKQEVDELTLQWQARKDIQTEAKTHQLAQEAKRFASAAVNQANADAQKLREGLQSLGELAPLSDGADEWPHAAWFAGLESRLEEAHAQLLTESEAAIAKYVRAVKAAFVDDGQWPQIKEDLADAESRFLAACETKGVLPADVSKLQEVDRQRTAKQADWENKQKRLLILQQRVGTLPSQLAQLHGLWRQQFEVRREACASIQNQTTLVTAGYMRDRRAFEAIWERLAPRDNRKRIGKQWEDVGASLFEAFAQSPELPSPWELLHQWMGDFGSIPEGSVTVSLAEDIVAHLLAPDVRAVWENIRLTRVDDLIDVELKRADGTSAGRMSGDGGSVLSEGQRNTALLSLILAEEGGGPIIIDQPEDELDSSYIFSDLVPLLRQKKNSRQLILATHNANLPVNADAELIYAFDARGGRGTKRAGGGLDRDAVTRSVLDIMEGSETAFKRRGEKYHF